MKKSVALLFTCLVCASSLFGQSYSYGVLAGQTGMTGASDGTGTAARFNQPSAVAVASNGDVYVVEFGNPSLRKITAAGVVSTIASIGNGGSAIALDSSGNAFISDAVAHVIRKVTSTGTVTVFAGEPGVSGNSDGSLTVARFKQPAGLAFDSAGNLYVADSGNHTIRKIATDGTVSSYAGLAGVQGFVDGQASLARFTYPSGIAVDATGAVFVTDYVNYVIRKIAADGTVTTFAGNNTYYWYSSYDGVGTAARFQYPTGLAIDPDGNLYVTEGYYSTIRKITPAAVVTTIGGQSAVQGSTDAIDTAARFNSPLGIAVDGTGNLYIADSNNATVRKGTLISVPTISAQPANVTTGAGQSVSFTVTASATGTLTYDWQRRAAGTADFASIIDGGAYSGALTATLTINPTATTMAGDQFRCVVTNSSVVSTTSAVATLTVTSPPTLTSVASANFYVGIAGTFTVKATAAPAASFSVSSGSLPSWATLNAATGVLSGTPTSTSGSPYTFTIAATNGIAPQATQAFTLTVQPAPTAPTSTLNGATRSVITKGQSFTLSGTPGGSAPLTYQWKRNGRAIPGATAATYSVSSATSADAGSYQLVVTNPAGSAASSAAFVLISYSRSEVVAWGYGVTLPSGLNSAVGIAAGNIHGLAVNADGTVAAFGDNSYGQATPPVGISNVVAVAAGSYHSLALKADGTVVAWGYNGRGQCTVPSGLNNVVAVAAGDSHSLALKSDGTVVGWGSTSYSESTVPAGLTGVARIAAWSSSSLAVKDDGTTVAWGSTTGYSPPSGWTNIVDAALGYSTVLGLRVDGTVQLWGSTSYIGTPPTGLSNVTAIAASGYQAIALKSDGTLVAWGDTYNYAGNPPSALRAVVAISAGANLRLALRDASNDIAPVVTTSPSSVAANVGQTITLTAAANAGTASFTYQWYRNGVAISGATNASYMLTASTATAGNYYAVASNSLGDMTTGTATVTVNSSPIISATSGGRIPLTVGDSLTLTLASSISNSATVQWRLNGRAIAGATSRAYTIANATLGQGGYYQAVYNEGSGAVTSAPAFVLVTPASTQLFGTNSSSYHYSTPYLPTGLTHVNSVEMYSGIGVAVNADGTINEWSDNGSISVNLSNVVSVSLGGSMHYALLGDGSVWSWSSSYYYSNIVPQPTPFTNVVAIAAGYNHVIALRGDGTVVGAGSAAGSAIPSSLNNVVAVAAGSGFSLALKADGTVVGWGQNDYGQSTPPSNLANVIAIAAGPAFAVALRSDGTVVAWGRDNGTTGVLRVPSGLSGIVAITAGDQHVYALRSDGSAIGWGSYNYYSDAIPTVAQRNIFALAGGSAQTVFVRDSSGDTAPTISTQPAAVALYTGQSTTLSVSATGGTASLTYQWRKDGAAISGATQSMLQLAYATSAVAGSYDVVVSDPLGTITSSAATVTVNSAVGVSVSPGGRQALTAGQSLTLTGTAAISGTISYQWLRNGQPITGATSSALALTNAAWKTNGTYQLRATNSVGPAVSAPVYVGVAVGAQVVSWTGSSSQPTQATAFTDVIRVAAGNNHSLALRTNGTIVAWGDNSFHQCDIPSDVTDVVAIAAGSGFSMALLADGTVRTWGYLNFTPSSVGLGLAIAASPNSSTAMVLRRDGTVVTWDSNGLRGDVPASLNGVVTIAIGSAYTLAAKSDGAVVQWTGSVAVPATATGVVGIATSGDTVLALKANGTVIAWGANYYGQTQMPAGLDHVAAIGGGGSSGFAVKDDGSVTVWGSSYDNLTLRAPNAQPVYQLAIGGSVAVALRDSTNDSSPVIGSVSNATTVVYGQSLVLNVSATGSPAPAYQWYLNGTAISGATTATLYVPSVESYNAGTYTVAVTNLKGSVVSSGITVIIRQPNLVGLTVSAARVDVTAGLAVGSFTVEGSSSKQVLVRAVGPTLAKFAIGNPMADPKLTITNAGGVVLTSNDDWGTASNATDLPSWTAYLGAYALNSGSKDATILRSFPPGTYHVAVTPATGAGGVAMLEFYDADAISRLAYTATLGQVGPGSSVLVQGITIKEPPIGRSYLIRVLGPGLGGANTLAKPQVAVYDSAGTLRASNAGWADSSTLATLGDSVGARALAAGSQDAALNFVPPGRGTYTVQAKGTGAESGWALLEIFEVDADRATAIAPAFVASPQPSSVLLGQSVTLGSVTIGKPAPIYQWKKDGNVVAGATNATLTLSNAQAGDAGSYTVVATNASGTAVSTPAALTVVTQTATHAVANGYVAGGTVTITNTLTYTGTASSLGWQVTIPAGWSYASSGGSAGDVAPAVGATGTIEWAWSSPPSSPVTFTYTLNVPAGETGTKTLSATALVRSGGLSDSATVAPATLSVEAAPLLHSADTNGDGKISLIELTRVIELYNTRNGTARTGCYAVQSGTEDGFTTDAGRASNAVVTLATYHVADSNHDGKISLIELTRIIELYNYRSGTTRTGQYHVQVGSEDGFAPGP